MHAGGQRFESVILHLRSTGYAVLSTKTVLSNFSDVTVKAVIGSRPITSRNLQQCRKFFDILEKSKLLDESLLSITIFSIAKFFGGLKLVVG